MYFDVSRQKGLEAWSRSQGVESFQGIMEMDLAADVASKELDKRENVSQTQGLEHTEGSIWAPRKQNPNLLAILISAQF